LEGTRVRQVAQRSGSASKKRQTGVITTNYKKRKTNHATTTEPFLSLAFLINYLPSVLNTDSRLEDTQCGLHPSRRTGDQFIITDRKSFEKNQQIL